MLQFHYYRSISPTLTVLLGLAFVEALVVHLLAIALWGRSVAIILGLLDLSLIVAILSLLRSIRRHPVTIERDVLTMRVGGLKVICVPLDHVAGLRASWDAAALKEPGVANLALATWPNIVVDLSKPVRVRSRAIHAIAHKLDDPLAFSDALLRAR